MPKYLLAFALCLPLLHGQATVESLLSGRLERDLNKFAETVDGTFGYAVIDLKTGRTLSLNGQVQFAQASAIKIPILVTMYRDVSIGRLKLDDAITLTAKDAVGGSGALQDKLKHSSQTLTLRELALLMVRDSDNTATNVIIAKVGMARVNALMTAMGFNQTRLRRIMMDTDAAARNDENVSTPLEMARLGAKIYRGEVEGAKEIVELLKTVKAAVRAAVPAEVEVASKPGEIPGVHTETAIVYLKDRPFVIAVAASALKDDAASPITPAARMVFEHFRRLASINAYGHRVR